MNGVVVRPATAADCGAIARIYNHYVRETIVTFEEQEVAAAAMEARLAEVAGASLPWLVAESDGTVAGFAYATKWKGRCAYRHSVESTIYLEPARTRAGLGSGPRPVHDASKDHMRTTQRGQSA